MQNNADKPVLTARQENFVAMLLCSRTIRDAARLAGVSERLSHKWLRENAAVQDEIRRRGREAVQQAGAALAGHLQTATETLAEVCSNPKASAPARVSAARSIWDICLRLREQDDLAGRLAELETVLVAVQLKGS